MTDLQSLRLEQAQPVIDELAPDNGQIERHALRLMIYHGIKRAFAAEKPAVSTNWTPDDDAAERLMSKLYDGREKPDSQILAIIRAALDQSASEQRERAEQAEGLLNATADERDRWQSLASRGQNDCTKLTEELDAIADTMMGWEISLNKANALLDRIAEAMAGLWGSREDTKLCYIRTILAERTAHVDATRDESAKPSVVYDIKMPPVCDGRNLHNSGNANSTAETVTRQGEG